MFESRALFPADRAVDVEKWPLLELTDVSVIAFRRGQHDELVDLFQVVEDGPFRVKGTLGPVPKKYRKAVKSESAVNQTIVIPKVLTYSMEYVAREDSAQRQIVIWVLGASAWYSISPSAEYRPFFDQLLEKTHAWLFLQEYYSARPQKEPEPSVMDVFKEFTEYDPKYRTARAASKLFGKHHRYLLFMMLKPESDVELWRRTPIFQYFEEEFGETTLEVMDFFGHVGKEVADDGSDDGGDDAEDDEEDDGDTDSDDGSSDGKPVSSKGRSVLRPQPSPAPARAADYLSPTAQRPKRRRAASAVAGSRLKRQAPCPPSPPPESSELESSEAEDSEPAGLPSPSPPPPPAQQRKEDAREVASRKPLEQADNYWKCTLDEARCSYMVANAKTRDGRHAVEEHYAWHGELMAEAMKTIDQEAQRNKAGTCHVPYLMQKIRMMSQHWEENKPPPLRGLGEE